jgi:hypothetical protein
MLRPASKANAQNDTIRMCYTFSVQKPFAIHEISIAEKYAIETKDFYNSEFGYNYFSYDYRRHKIKHGLSVQYGSHGLQFGPVIRYESNRYYSYLFDRFGASTIGPFVETTAYFPTNISNHFVVSASYGLVIKRADRFEFDIFGGIESNQAIANGFTNTLGLRFRYKFYYLGFRK